MYAEIILNIIGLVNKMAITDAMIPYVIEQAVSNGAYTNEANIITTYGTTLLSTLESTFIKIVVDMMYEFCSAEYGHAIEISSYGDFQSKYYKENGRVKDRPILEFKYFNECEWKLWEVQIYDTEIYSAYKERTKI